VANKFSFHISEFKLNYLVWNVVRRKTLSCDLVDLGK